MGGGMVAAPRSPLPPPYFQLIPVVNEQRRLSLVFLWRKERMEKLDYSTLGLCCGLNIEIGYGGRESFPPAVSPQQHTDSRGGGGGEGV